MPRLARYVAVCCLWIFVLIWHVSFVGGGKWNKSCLPICRCDLKVSQFSGLKIKTVECTYRGLSIVPRNISVETESLVFSGNMISNLEQFSWLRELRNLSEFDVSYNKLYGLEGLDFSPVNAQSIRYLNFDHNEIDYLPNRSLSGLDQLLHLSISSNFLESIHPEALAGLPSLQTLLLNGNRLFTVDPRWFKMVPNLVNLNLAANSLNVIRGGTFEYVPHLRTLDLSGNKLRTVQRHAFDSLRDLKRLDLSRNHIRTVSSLVFQGFSKIDLIDLSDNLFQRFSGGSFSNTNVTVLKLNQMRSLFIVYSYAFKRLPYLTRLEMADNPNLRFVDTKAFVKTPQLKELLLQNNNLSVLQKNTISHMGSLSVIGLYGNPLVCDCNAQWILASLNSTTRRNITFKRSRDMTCGSPAEFKGKSFAELDAADVPEECAPVVLQLFKQIHNKLVGDDILLECRAVGVPEPEHHWLYPSSGAKNNTTPKQTIWPSDTLMIEKLELRHAGKYTCLASNPHGRDERFAHVTVKHMKAGLLVLHVTATSITVTWTGVEHAHRYKLIYRRSSTNSTHTLVEIKPYMRSYSASELSPSVTYEVCICMLHNSDTVEINCTAVKTRATDSIYMGVFSTRDYIVGVSITCVLLAGLVMCSMTYAVKRYNRRKRAEDWYGDGMSQMFMASIDSLSDTTPITYENRAAEFFDEDDIEEIRTSAAEASADINAASTSGIK